MIAPKDSFAVIGGTVRLPCSTTLSNPVFWRHVSFEFQTLNDVYNDGNLLGEYRSGRHEVLVNLSTGQYDLFIRDIQFKDAGTYICIDNEGIGTRADAELTIFGMYYNNKHQFD